MITSELGARRTATRLISGPWRRQEIRYLVVGGFNTAVGLVLYAGFHAMLGRQLGYLLVLVPTYAVGIVISFVTQRYLVFGVRGPAVRQFLRFTLVQMSGLGLNALLLALFHGLTPIPPVPSEAITLFLVAVATYFSHRLFSFRRTHIVD